MPGSATTRDRPRARDHARVRLAFRYLKGVGVPIALFAAQWLAYASPCRRFAPDLTIDGARLGASAARYAFTVGDFHLLFLAGLPAH